MPQKTKPGMILSAMGENLIYGILGGNKKKLAKNREYL